jgi:uncharacterized membrane protein
LVVATLVVIAYADQGVGEEARKSVQELEDELTIQADHVASITRDVEGRYHTHISQCGAPGCAPIGWGGFWAALFGRLFFVPVAGLALGQGEGVLRDHLVGIGVDKGFQNRVREQLKPGTSEVFMVIEGAAPDKAVAALARYGGTMSETSLSDEEFERLRHVLEGGRPRTRQA